MLDVRSLEDRISAEMEREGVLSLAVAITDAERLIYTRGFGTTGIAPGQMPVDALTLFRVGSTTKPLTAALVMCLIERGVLELDAPIRRYVPEVELGQEGLADQVTLRMLLSHRSGLPPAGEDIGFCGEDAMRRFALETIPRYELVAPPGKLYSYSNAGFNLIGYLVEAATGRSFEELMEGLLFAPLGMARTTFDPTIALTYPTALPHVPGDDGVPWPVHRFSSDRAGNPSGFAISSACDMARFARMLLRRGSFEDRRVLSEESVAEMGRPHTDLLTADDTRYGLGLFVRSYKSVRVLDHGGSIDTYNSRFSLAPDHGLAIVLLSNRPLTGGLVTLVNDLWDELLTFPEPESRGAPPDRSAWSGMTGAYLGPRCGLAEVEVSGDELTLTLNGVRVPLGCARPAVYTGIHPLTGRKVSVGFVEEADGPVEYAMVNGQVAKRYARDAVEVPVEVPSGYVGTYQGFDIIRVRIERDDLRIRSGWYDHEMGCVALSSSLFASDYGTLEFVTDAEGIVSGLVVWGQFRLDRATDSS